MPLSLPKLTRTALAIVAISSATATVAMADTIFSTTASPFVNGSATRITGLVLPQFGPVVQYAQNIFVISDSFNFLTSVETVMLSYDNLAQFSQNGVSGYSLLPSTATYTFAGRRSSDQTGTFAETLVAATSTGVGSNGNTIVAQLDPLRIGANTGSVTIAPTTGGYNITNTFSFNSELSLNGGPFVPLPTETGTSLPIGFTEPISVAPVPEPSSLSLVALPLAGIAFLGLRRSI